MTPLDLEPIRERFLPACVHNIAVIENTCACRQHDPRWAIAELIQEVEQLRAAATRKVRAEEGWGPAEARALMDVAIRIGMPLAGGKVRKRLKQLKQAFAELDQHRARLAGQSDSGETS